MAVCVAAPSEWRRQLPQFDRASKLFEPFLPCDSKALRRVYLRLALQYHPDKHGEAEKARATELFQAIAAAYEELLGGGSSSDKPTRVKSPVAAAAELGDLDELRRLLVASPLAATEVDDLGVCPLMFAAAGGCIAAARMVMEFGGDLHAKNPINWSVLLYAALGDHAEMVRWLVGQGLPVTDHELILAAYTGNSRAFRVLIELYTGDVPKVITNESRKTLLHLACEGMCFLKSSADRHADCVASLIDCKVPIDAVDPKRRRTCLQDYVSDVRWKTRKFEDSAAHMSTLEALCIAGASVTYEDLEGHSALAIAMDSELRRVREVLLSYA